MFPKLVSSSRLIAPFQGCLWSVAMPEEEEEKEEKMTERGCSPPSNEVLIISEEEEEVWVDGVGLRTAKG